jgi:hypothetical protein
MSSGSASTTAAAAGQRDMKRARRIRNALGAVNLCDHLAMPPYMHVVDFLESLAIAKLAPTCPTKTISGVESCCAVWMPIAALQAPGPRVTKRCRASRELAVGFPM